MFSTGVAELVLAFLMFVSVGSVLNVKGRSSSCLYVCMHMCQETYLMINVYLGAEK